MRRKAGKVRLVGRGGLELPENLASELGLEPGYEIAVEPLGNSGAILKSFSSLAKLYIEPNNHCNLDCEMCMRGAWKDVAMGFMEWSTFRFRNERGCFRAIHFQNLSSQNGHLGARKAGARLSFQKRVFGLLGWGGPLPGPQPLSIRGKWFSADRLERGCESLSSSPL